MSFRGLTIPLSPAPPLCFVRFCDSFSNPRLLKVGKPIRSDVWTWSNEDTFRLIDLVARYGKRWVYYKANASQNDNWGISPGCLEKDRMKEKWASLKRHPKALREKSIRYYNLFLSLENEVQKSNYWMPERKEAVPDTMGSQAPIMPDEPSPRRVGRPRHQRQPKDRIHNPYLRFDARNGSIRCAKPKDRYPPASVTITAKYKSRPGKGCPICKRPIEVGQDIHNVGTSTKATWTHALCLVVD